MVKFLKILNQVSIRHIGSNIAVFLVHHGQNKSPGDLKFAWSIVKYNTKRSLNFELHYIKVDPVPDNVTYGTMLRMGQYFLHSLLPRDVL